MSPGQVYWALVTQGWHATNCHGPQRGQWSCHSLLQTETQMVCFLPWGTGWKHAPSHPSTGLTRGENRSIVSILETCCIINHFWIMYSLNSAAVREVGGFMRGKMWKVMHFFELIVREGWRKDDDGTSNAIKHLWIWSRIHGQLLMKVIIKLLLNVTLVLQPTVLLCVLTEGDVGRKR